MFEDDVVAQIPRLRSYAHKLTRNTPNADDLVQETTLKALDKQHLFAQGSDVCAWMFTIMHNLHATHVRQVVNRSLVRIDPLLDCNSNAEMRVLVREVVDGLERLPPSTRRIIECVTAGMTYAEVGRRERIPMGTVRSRLWRGRAMLREFVEG